MKFYRIALLPISLIIWYLLAFYSCKLTLNIFLIIFNLDIVLILLLFPFLISVVALFTNFPFLLKNLINKIFGLNYIVLIIHSIVGLIAILNNINFFYSITELINDLIINTWYKSKFKTIVLFFPFIGLTMSILFNSVISLLINNGK